MFVPISWFPYQLLLQTVFSEMHFSFERQIQLSVPGIYGNFACPTKFAHCLNRDLFSLRTQILQHMQQDCCLAPCPQCRRMNLQLSRCLAPVPQCCGLKLKSTTLEPCLLPNAGCCLLRIGEEDGQNPRRLRQCSSGRSPGWRTFLEESISHFQPSTKINLFSLSLICPLTRLTQFQSLRCEFSIGFMEGTIRASLFPISFVQFVLQPQIVFSELGILLEQPIQLSAQGRLEDFSFRTEFADLPNLDLFFLSTESLQHLKVTQYLAPVSWCLTTCRRQATGLPHLLVLAAGYHWLPLADENRRKSRMLRLWW